MTSSTTIKATALPDFPDVKAGDDLAALIGEGLGRANIEVAARDVIVVAQKIVSKTEGRKIALADVKPSPRATEIAAKALKDPRLVELILSESQNVLRVVPNVIVVRHRLGFVLANAGIDRSNVGPPGGEESALLLPLDPDSSAARIRDGIAARLGVAPAVVITDSFGRAWRLGTVNVAIGVAGLPALVDRRGTLDRYGRTLETTEVAFADAVAAAAGLAMGEGAEGRPVVHMSGLEWSAPAQSANALIRPIAEDLFR
ncbi:MAG: coenzyme F420-0:L-glutamate ligase [Rhodospirillaceae bacterium]|nr:MAG: coenzyme F420-0:L-glutamate ligase [Rhodospirillaceae bacterium]